ncbi:predicted protein [Nematostella vectensis]|uniref:UMOD/GP2/OIT3-like D8C domain-containing protein n=1 Tax=Nematostella vectensis TaxID=45351 RepID=A7SUQ8_NEMVE|nr:predicted protein [Nematostella vectensis]|eukprot:XP_001624667.1 predicted protein [Nematostella vectensis]
MGRFAACILVLYAFTGFKGTSDGRSCPRPAGPCSAANYIPIKDPHRSTKYRYKRPQPALCDYLLQPGWYRFTSSVGGEIPTTKPEPNMCGTLAPIWMRGTHPETIGATKETTACVNVNNRNNGCFRSIDMCVEMCSGGYYVYYLRPPYGCSMEYCAGRFSGHQLLELVTRGKRCVTMNGCSCCVTMNGCARCVTMNGCARCVTMNGCARCVTLYDCARCVTMNGCARCVTMNGCARCVTMNGYPRCVTMNGCTCCVTINGCASCVMMNG